MPVLQGVPSTFGKFPSREDLVSAYQFPFVHEDWLVYQATPHICRLTNLAAGVVGRTPRTQDIPEAAHAWHGRQVNAHSILSSEPGTFYLARLLAGRPFTSARSSLHHHARDWTLHTEVALTLNILANSDPRLDHLIIAVPVYQDAAASDKPALINSLGYVTSQRCRQQTAPSIILSVTWRACTETV